MAYLSTSRSSTLERFVITHIKEFPECQPEIKQENNDMIKCQPYLNGLIYVRNANCDITVPSTCKVNKKKAQQKLFLHDHEDGKIKKYKYELMKNGCSSRGS